MSEAVLRLQVTYSSNPRAAGGPILRSPPGQILFSKQQLRQTLTPPETLINNVNFKCLGLFPGSAKQPAVIQPLTGNTYKVYPWLQLQSNSDCLGFQRLIYQT